MAIVHIHIGADLPSYFGDTVTQSRKFYEGTIYLVIPRKYCNSKYFEELNCSCIPCEDFEEIPKIKKLKSVSFLNKYGTDDFWHVTMQRLFVLEELMIRENLSDILHLENDVTIYFDPSLYFPVFQQIYKNAVAVTPLGPSEGCTAAVLYVHDVAALSKVTSRMIELLEEGETAIIKRVPRSVMVHEMMLLGIIQSESPQVVKTFPVLPHSAIDSPVQPRRVKPILRLLARTLDRICPQTFLPPTTFELNNYISDFKGIFDPASLGQYLGGMPSPHKSGPGVIHRNHWIAPDLLAKRYEIIWKKDGLGRKLPFIKEMFNEKKEWRIFSLHIHCKDIVKFSS